MCRRLERLDQSLGNGTHDELGNLFFVSSTPLAQSVEIWKRRIEWLLPGCRELQNCKLLINMYKSGGTNDRRAAEHLSRFSSEIYSLPNAVVCYCDEDFEIAGAPLESNSQGGRSIVASVFWTSQA